MSESVSDGDERIPYFAQSTHCSVALPPTAEALHDYSKTFFMFFFFHFLSLSFSVPFNPFSGLDIRLTSSSSWIVVVGHNRIISAMKRTKLRIRWSHKNIQLVSHSAASLSLFRRTKKSIQSQSSGSCRNTSKS